MRYLLGTAALAAIFAAATPAAAQITSTANAEARGLILTSNSLAKQRDLDFGAVTVDQASDGGDITIAAQEVLSRNLDPDITALAGVASSAKFVGYGSPGETVTLTLTQPSGGVLQGPGVNTIPVTLFQDVDAGSKLVGSSSTFEAFVGGTFTIDPLQASGLYSGAFTLTAEYP